VKGEARITDTGENGGTALLHADTLQILRWLLAEGGACITDRMIGVHSSLLVATACGSFTTCQWLLEHGGADIKDATDKGSTVWDMLGGNLIRSDAAEVTALLRVMVLNGTPPAEMVARLRPEHARVVEEGARLRAALPAYLAQRRALLDAHCPLIAPLLALVRGYDPEPTTTEELWATGLGVAPQRARRLRPYATVVLSLRRSARLRQRLE
jgi:hypothetical protein